MVEKNKIERLAYQLWEDRGRSHGAHDEDWRQAETQLAILESEAAAARRSEEASLESFPASDAPASHLPDTPPSNADEKWAAANAAKRNKTASHRI